MDWALITWGILIGMVGLLWIMVVASVQDETTAPHSDEANEQAEVPDEAGHRQEQYERHAAA
ncbi:MAG TPA: hypothetical protein VJV04_05090 [Nitrospiraceae bacterium]|nr:hypothetical protein [Nitrospiraceae bacterium]